MKHITRIVNYGEVKFNGIEVPLYLSDKFVHISTIVSRFFN